MPKMKTHKGILKRCRISARGKIIYKRPNSNHLMSAKSGKRCRRIRRVGVLDNAFCRRILEATGRAKDRRPGGDVCTCGHCSKDKSET